MTTDKETVAMDEEAQPSHQNWNNHAPQGTLVPRKRILQIGIVLSVTFFALGLISGAFGIDTSSDDKSEDFHSVGQTIVSADTPRQVYSITPVALGKEGRRLAIGDPVYYHDTDPELVLGDSTEDRRGRVRIFDLKNDRWELVGQVLYGASHISAFGYSVDLSVDGNTLAVGARNHNNTRTDEFIERPGAVYVYDFDDDEDEWKLRGEETVTGDSLLENNEMCGGNVALSQDGNIVGYTCNGRGEFHVSTWDEDEQLWSDSSVVTPNGQFGHQMTLSADGETVLITQYGTSNARVYDKIQQDGNVEWLVRDSIADEVNLASKLADETVSVPSPSSASNYEGAFAMSKDGVILAVLYEDAEDQTQSVIRTFIFNGRLWKQFGTDMLPPRHDVHGHSPYNTDIDLSADGRKLVVTISRATGDSDNMVIVYEYSRLGKWEQSGKPILGSNGVLRVDMSSDGSMVATSNSSGRKNKDFVVRTYHQQS